jgi:hypothetical protein
VPWHSAFEYAQPGSDAEQCRWVRERKGRWSADLEQWDMADEQANEIVTQQVTSEGNDQRSWLPMARRRSRRWAVPRRRRRFCYIF